MIQNVHRTFECSFNVLGKGCVNYSKQCTADENLNLQDFFISIKDIKNMYVNFGS